MIRAQEGEFIAVASPRAVLLVSSLHDPVQTRFAVEAGDFLAILRSLMRDPVRIPDFALAVPDDRAVRIAVHGDGWVQGRSGMGSGDVWVSAGEVLSWREVSLLGAPDLVLGCGAYTGGGGERRGMFALGSEPTRAGVLWADASWVARGNGMAPAEEFDQTPTEGTSQVVPVGTCDRVTAKAADFSVHRVAGLTCPNGHAGPPDRSTCWVCGTGVPRGTPVRVVRPQLGALRFFEGTRLPLGGTHLIGRSPRDAPGRDPVVLVTVPSPTQEVSRTHVRVSLEGWFVIVEDLGSKNGTFVLAPGAPPRRLRGGEPVVITRDTMVNLGDGVSFMLEGAP